MVALQRHILRGDGDLIAHMTASLSYREKAKLEKEIMPMVKSFKPPFHE
jgi:hypothetical protein